jgi:hypothetical protein
MEYTSPLYKRYKDHKEEFCNLDPTHVHVLGASKPLARVTFRGVLELTTYFGMKSVHKV